MECYYPGLDRVSPVAVGTLLTQLGRKTLFLSILQMGKLSLGQKLIFVQMDALSLVSTVNVLPVMSPALLGSFWDCGLGTFGVGFWVLKSMVLVEPKGRVVNVRRHRNAKTGSGINLSREQWGLGRGLKPEPAVLPTASRKKEAFLILISSHGGVLCFSSGPWGPNPCPASQ